MLVTATAKGTTTSTALSTAATTTIIMTTATASTTASATTTATIIYTSYLCSNFTTAHCNTNTINTTMTGAAVPPSARGGRSGNTTEEAAVPLVTIRWSSKKT